MQCILSGSCPRHQCCLHVFTQLGLSNGFLREDSKQRSVVAPEKLFRHAPLAALPLRGSAPASALSPSTGGLPFSFLFGMGERMRMHVGEIPLDPPPLLRQLECLLAGTAQSMLDKLVCFVELHDGREWLAALLKECEPAEKDAVAVFDRLCEHNLHTRELRTLDVILLSVVLHLDIWIATPDAHGPPRAPVQARRLLREARLPAMLVIDEQSEKARLPFLLLVHSNAAKPLSNGVKNRWFVSWAPSLAGRFFPAQPSP